MVKSKLVLGVASLLFGSAATAGLIAQAEALYVPPPVKPLVNNPVLQVVETSVDPVTEPEILAIIDSIETVFNNTVPGNGIPAVIGLDTVEVISDEGNSLTAATHVEALISLPRGISQPVPAPPVFWLFVTGLVAIIGFGKQGKAA